MKHFNSKNVAIFTHLHWDKKLTVRPTNVLKNLSFFFLKNKEHKWINVVLGSCRIIQASSINKHVGLWGWTDLFTLLIKHRHVVLVLFLVSLSLSWTRFHQIWCFVDGTIELGPNFILFFNLISHIFFRSLNFIFNLLYLLFYYFTDPTSIIHTMLLEFRSFCGWSRSNSWD